MRTFINVFDSFLLSPFFFRFWGNRFFVLVISLLFPTFVLFPISACSFFALLVPFFTRFVPFLVACINFACPFCASLSIFYTNLYLFIYLVSFYPKTLIKDTTLCFSCTHPCRAQLLYRYYFMLLLILTPLIPQYPMVSSCK